MRPAAALPAQRGAVALMLALLLTVLFGFLGIVLDLGHLYIRKTELQNAADAAALAGVRQLNGRTDGINAAVSAAIATAAANQSDFNHLPVSIGETEIDFAAAPDGPWQTPAAARTAPANLRFVRVDTTGIAQGTRPTWFMPLVNPALASATASGVAVAGATLCEGVPMFICAPSGGGSFKKGQAYFFGEAPGGKVGPGNIGYFDPVPPGAPALIKGANDMRDILCAGKMFCTTPGTYSSLTQNAFGTLAAALNTRFDDFKGGLPAALTPARCRPDSNIHEFPYTDFKPLTKNTAWMSNPPDRQSEDDSGATLGVHWSAVLPTGTALTGVNAVPTANYPASGTPYSQTGGRYFKAPSHPAEAQPGRRILTLAVATNCGSGINGSGKPVIIDHFARFFLPVPAGTGGSKGIHVEYIEDIPSPLASPPEIRLYR